MSNDSTNSREGFLGELKKKSWAVLLAALVAIITAFSDKIVERTTLAVSRIEQRTMVFESLSANLSNYVFLSEVFLKAFDDEWIKRSGLETLVPDYNKAIIAMRSKEYVYRSKVRRFWGAPEEAQLVEVIEVTRSFDDLVHDLNVEIGAVTSKEKDT